MRSSGPGGQHVNKVASKVQLSFNIEASKGLSEEEKILILKNLGKRLTKEHILLLACEEHKSQHKNKDLVISKCFSMLKKALKIPKKRKKTNPSKASIEKRLASKRKESQKKASRRRPEDF